MMNDEGVCAAKTRRQAIGAWLRDMLTTIAAGAIAAAAAAWLGSLMLKKGQPIYATIFDCVFFLVCATCLVKIVFGLVALLAPRIAAKARDVGAIVNNSVWALSLVSFGVFWLCQQDDLLDSMGLMLLILASLGAYMLFRTVAYMRSVRTQRRNRREL